VGLRPRPPPRHTSDQTTVPGLEIENWLRSPPEPTEVKKTSVILLAALLLNAASAGSASAAWFIGGEALAFTAALATTAAVDEVTKLSGDGVELECDGTTLNGIGPEIKALNTFVATSLIFTGYKALTKSCTLSKTEVGTVPVVAELTTLPTRQEEQVLQFISVNTTVTEAELKLLSSAAKLSGSALLKLASKMVGMGSNEVRYLGGQNQGA
jgi:hypothetical protein